MSHLIKIYAVRKFSFFHLWYLVNITSMRNNSLNTGVLFHCYMFEESIYHFRGGGSIL